MPRTARMKSETGIYHMVMRGINRQSIFEDNGDYWRFIKTLKRYKEICGYKLFAYSLMDSHTHILLKEEVEPLEQIMRRLCGSFVYWYNWKYDRVGNLFQDRFKSEPVEDDAYFLSVLRYIHQNPLQADLVKDISHYRWSSYSEYLNPKGFVDVDFALNIFHPERKKAIQSFVEYHRQWGDNRCLDVDDKKRLTDREAREIIKKTCLVKFATELQRMEKSTRNELLKKLVEECNIPVRQLSRVTGISRGVVTKAKG